jgi:hypothetical protein
MSAMRVPSLAFTFATFRERTPGLSGSDRMAVFYSLPEALQRSCWDDLSERADHRSALDCRDWCGDDR